MKKSKIENGSFQQLLTYLYNNDINKKHSIIKEKERKKCKNI